MQAVTLDFYETLVHHRTGAGRGATYVAFLAREGLASAPWEHRMLYDAFELYGERYRPELDDDARRAFWVEFTRRLFAISAVDADPNRHAEAVREIMGPRSLALFDDALPTLRALRERGLRLAVVSDWQKGLTHFTEELGVRPLVDTVVVSAEEGFQKPDPRLFEVARARLDVPAREILHVGDSPFDVEGAQAAGFSAVQLLRDEEATPATDSVPVIRSLRELEGWDGLPSE